MKENNELFAKFMGIEVTYHGPVLYLSEDGWIDFTEDATPYWPDRNWNQLMGVVQKISRLYSEFDFNTIEEENMFLDVLDNPVKYDISDTYMRIVAFIQWYTTKQQAQTQPPSKSIEPSSEL